MSLIIWGKEFEVMHKGIDSQHQKIIEIYNRLFTAMKKGEAESILREILGELVDYSVYHFKLEEELMAKVNFPGTKAHKKTHQYFCSKIEEFKHNFDNETEYISLELIEYLKDWITMHILKEDKKYGSYL